jgi:hypothetical protein
MAQARVITGAQVFFLNVLYKVTHGDFRRLL